MEIKIKENIFHCEEKKINGITGNQLENIEKMLTLNSKDSIYINNKKLNDEEKIQYKKKIETIEEQFIVDNSYKSVYEWLWVQMKRKSIYPKNILKKVTDAMKIVGLREDILKSGLLDCSTSEKKQLQLAAALLSNPDIILLIEPFKCLDSNNQKQMKNILKKYAEKYSKIIIIVSDSAEMIYQNTEYVIFYKNGKVILEGNTTELYQNVDLLKKHRIEIPEIIEITYLARKNKNIKIDYYKDIRDIIKDIYKHVKR